MESVIVSINPEWIEKIVRGEKTIEVRKSAPKEVPFKAYIYCTKEKPFIQKIKFGDIAISHTQISKNLYNGKVIGEFICDKVYDWECKNRFELVGELGLPTWRASYMIFVYDLEKICLTYDDLWEYGKGKTLYGWHISDLKIYDKPKELIEFRACNFKSMNGTDVCGNYDCKYYRDSGSYMIPPSCAKNKCIITRPPQSWQYLY